MKYAIRYNRDDNPTTLPLHWQDANAVAKTYLPSRIPCYHFACYVRPKPGCKKLFLIKAPIACLFCQRAKVRRRGK